MTRLLEDKNFKQIALARITHNLIPRLIPNCRSLNCQNLITSLFFIKLNIHINVSIKYNFKNEMHLSLDFSFN